MNSTNEIIRNKCDQIIAFCGYADKVDRKGLEMKIRNIEKLAEEIKGEMEIISPAEVELPAVAEDKLDEPKRGKKKKDYEPTEAVPVNDIPAPVLEDEE